MKRRIFYNSFSGLSLYVVNVMVAFFMSPFLLRSLGNRDYGVWELILSLIGYMGLLDLGIGPALVRFVAVADGERNRDDLREILSTAFLFFAVVGICSAGVLALVSREVTTFAGLEPSRVNDVSNVILILGLNLCLSFVLQVFVSAEMGMQRHFLVNLTRCVVVVARALLFVYFIRKFPQQGLLLLIVLEVFFSLLQLIVFSLSLRLNRSLPPISLSFASFGRLRELLCFGLKSTVMLVASRLQNQSIPIIITAVIGVGQIPFFTLPNRLVDYAKGISQAIGFPLTSYFGFSFGRGKDGEMLTSWINTTLALQAIALPVPVFIFFYGEDFLRLWLGVEYSIIGRGILYCLLPGLVADSFATNAVRVLTAKGAHGRNAAAWLILAVLSIPLGIFGASRWGIVGVALGTTVVATFGNMITLFMACSKMGISVARFLRDTTGHLMAPLACLFCCCFLLRANYFPGSYAEILVHLTSGGLIYIVALCGMTMLSGSKSKLGRIVEEMLNS